MHVEYVWMPGEIEKINRPLGGAVGFYSFKTLEQAIEAYDCYRVASDVIFGSVKMWGEVVEHERGYRAQYARVDRIISGGYWGRRFRERKWQFWRPNRLARVRELYEH
jgi:hypothetical protein